MKKYSFQLQGNTVEKVWFGVIFTLACFTIIFIPLAIVLLITSLELVETP